MQVILAVPPNQPHRAEIAKLLVHRSARRRGIAQLLMERAETEALAEGKTLLVLDTVTGDPAERLYERHGLEQGRRDPRLRPLPGRAALRHDRLLEDAPVRDLGRSRSGGVRGEQRDLADDVVDVRPDERLDVVPALHLLAQIDRARASEHRAMLSR